MTMHIEAVYEHGVLRPTKPLNLLDGARVRLALIASSEIEARRLARPERDAREIETLTRLLINSARRPGMRSIMGGLSPRKPAGLNRALKAALAIEEEIEDENG